MRFWKRYAQIEELSAYADVQQIFQIAKKKAFTKKVTAQIPIGFDLFHQVMQAVGQGLSNNEILKILP